MLQAPVMRHKLANGLTVLIAPSHHTPKVSIQLWYNVGSKYEPSSKKGIAHFIEHMIFKGTDKLSESDINLVTHKLSGYCNAFTSHDYTGYLFDLASHNWHEALPIMADCMIHCTFREEHLRSELKAVVQELKMYKDDYVSTLIEGMMSTIFADHPYRYPIIGYKQDLWHLERQHVIEFYKKYYVPNNATLVIVGDVDVVYALELVEKSFGQIAPHPDIVKPLFYHAPQLASTTLTLLREIQQPIGLVAWEVPGVIAKNEYILDLVSWLLGSGKGARLYRKIVEELQLATDVDSFSYDLAEHSLFAITFEPREGIAPQKVAAAIVEEIAAVAHKPFTERELQRAVRKTSLDLVALEEQHQKYAYLLGKYFSVLGDENYCAKYTQQVPEHILPDVVDNYVKTYLRGAVSHYGYVLPVTEKEQHFWSLYQEQSDAEDMRILSTIKREAPVEKGVYVDSLVLTDPKPFAFPQCHSFVLDNGLTVLWHHDSLLPTVHVVLELKFKHYYDPEDKQGLAMFLTDVMQEGTTHRSAVEFADEIEQYGMSLHAVPGLISLRMLKDDIERGLDLLVDLLCNATLQDTMVEKVRERMLGDVRTFWDTPSKCAAQLMKEVVYKGHPYHRAALGAVQSLQSITQEDLRMAQAAWISPDGAAVALVGNLEGIDVELLIKRLFSQWKRSSIIEPAFPAVPLVAPIRMVYPMKRDQIVLALGRRSVARTDQDFDALLLFDQVFTGGALGSMSSRLFQLRERSGLFYTISGSLVSGAGKEPGMAYISTIVSPERLLEAQEAIAAVVDERANNLTAEELREACRAVESTIIDLFATQRYTAAAFLFLQEYKLPADYFSQRGSRLRAISVQQVRDAVEKVLRMDTFSCIMVGRVASSDQH